VPALAVDPSFEGQLADTDWIAVLRMVRLLRVVRLSRVSRDIDIFCKGIWSGLRESAIVWAILILLTFVFSVLLTTYATDELREKVFSSLRHSMHVLFRSGIVLDGASDVLDDMMSCGDTASYLLFVLFVVVSQYIMLNLLTGLMVSEAQDLRDEEVARSKLTFLRRQLENISECYIQDDGFISKREFGLIINNADVHNMLGQFGANIQSISLMEESLYAKSDHITFESMFQAIADLVDTKHTTVRDAFHLQDVLQRSLRSIENQLAALAQARSALQ
jgi:hypothetical protein